MVKDTSILDPLSPARTEILRGNRSRGAGQDLKWHGSVATCKLTLYSFNTYASFNIRLRLVLREEWGQAGLHPLGAGQPAAQEPSEI
jgi:hypothetical protein